MSEDGSVEEVVDPRGEGWPGRLQGELTPRSVQRISML